jgi:hypothetical protein
MKNNQTCLDGRSKEPIFETNFENMLLSSQLVSEIHKKPDQISLTMTVTGLIELVKTIRLKLLEEIESQPPKESNSEVGVMTKQEVIEKLNVSSTTLWLWEKKKYLVSVKIGRRIFYRRCDIENLMEGKRV